MNMDTRRVSEVCSNGVIYQNVSGVSAYAENADDNYKVVAMTDDRRGLLITGCFSQNTKI